MNSEGIGDLLCSRDIKFILFIWIRPVLIWMEACFAECEDVTINSWSDYLQSGILIYSSVSSQTINEGSAVRLVE